MITAPRPTRIARFHHAIVKASGNRMLEHVWQTMRLSITTCVTHCA